MLELERLTEDVSNLLGEVGRSELLPRLARAADSAREKAAGEIVTEADLAAEAVLTLALRDLLPGSVVVGEEAAHANPTLLRGLDQHTYTWLVDPLDGTRHFAEGHGPFGIMVALLEHGVALGAWIHLPQTDELATAWRGRGAVYGGVPIQLPAPPADAPLTGALLTRFLPEPLRTHAETTQGIARTNSLHHCAARRYVDHLLGKEQFAAYWRTLPWDHVPGSLMVTEAGGQVRRFDGTPFLAHDVEGTSLLVASDRTTWDTILRRFLTLPTG